MSPQDFAYWLRSLFEFQPDLKTLNEAQVALIKKHLDLVIQNVTGVVEVVAGAPTGTAGTRPFLRGALLQQHSGLPDRFC